MLNSEEVDRKRARVEAGASATNPTATLPGRYQEAIVCPQMSVKKVMQHLAEIQAQSRCVVHVVNGTNQDPSAVVLKLATNTQACLDDCRNRIHEYISAVLSTYKGELPEGYERRTLTIPESSVGSVVGPRGAVIRAIQRDSGAKLDIAPRLERTTGGDQELALVGGRDQVAAAVWMVHDVMEGHYNVDAALLQQEQDRRAKSISMGGQGRGVYAGRHGDPNIQEKRVIYVPVEHVGSLVGPKGAVLRALQLDSGAKVDMEPAPTAGSDSTRDPRALTISGMSPQVASGYEMAMSVLEGTYDIGRAVERAGGTPLSRASTPGGSNSRQSQQQRQMVPPQQSMVGRYPYSMMMNPPTMMTTMNNSQQQQQQMGAMQSPPLPQPAMAPIHMTDAPGVRVLSIPYESIGSIVGPGGVVLWALQNDSGAKVDMEKAGVTGQPRPLTIKGDSIKIEKAMEIIHRVLQGQFNVDDAIMRRRQAKQQYQQQNEGTA